MTLDLIRRFWVLLNSSCSFEKSDTVVFWLTLSMTFEGGCEVSSRIRVRIPDWVSTASAIVSRREGSPLVCRIAWSSERVSEQNDFGIERFEAWSVTPFILIRSLLFRPTSLLTFIAFTAKIPFLCNYGKRYATS